MPLDAQPGDTNPQPEAGPKLLEVLRKEIDEADTFEATLRAVVERQLGLLENQRDLAEVVTVNLRQSSKLLKQYAAPRFTEYLEVIASVIAFGQQEGIVDPDLSPRVVATGLWGALDGIALTWALGGKAEKPEALRRAATQIASVFLGGVRAHHP